MRRDPSELKRYTASERANHWVVGICFILLGLSGLALFHPMFYPLALLFGGGTWVRILHPFLGLVMAAFFTLMALRFWRLNVLTPIDWQWLSRVRELVDGDEHNMPEVGKYNGGQKLLFWMLIGWARSCTPPPPRP
jgi:formate dehydrogenase subunit gamma